MTIAEHLTIRRKNLFLWIVTILLLIETIYEGIKVVLDIDEIHHWAYITLLSYYVLIALVIYVRFAFKYLKCKCCRNKEKNKTHPTDDAGEVVFYSE